MSYHVLVAGAGYVGLELARQLAEAGHRVWALSRTPRPVPIGAVHLRADLGDRRTLDQLPAVDFAVFCASAGGSSPEAYEKLYVGGLENLIDGLRATKRLRRLFFTSSTAVYAQEDGSWVDEASPTEPSHFSGRITLQAEELLARSPLPATTLRCSGIYGPGRTRLVDGVRAGSLRLPPQDRYTNRIHRDDLAGAALHLMASSDLPSHVVVSDDEPALYSDVLTHLAQQLGKPVPSAAPDAPPLRRGGHKRCCNGLLKRLGYGLRFPTFREGYAPLLREAPPTGS